MRTWCATALKLAWVSYCLLTSFYCLLAFLPYTYCAFIKAPPYAWMPWFVKHHTVLYWAASFALALSCLQDRRKVWFYPAFAALALVGLVLSIWPFMPSVHDDNLTYILGLAALLPILLVALCGLFGSSFWIQEDKSADSSLAFSTGVKIAVLVALLHAGGSLIRRYLGENGSLLFQPLFDTELVVWSVVSHVCVAIAIISALNLIRKIAALHRPRLLRILILTTLIVAFLWFSLVRFFAGALSFEGWHAHLYAATFSLTATLFGVAIVTSFVSADHQPLLRPKLRHFMLAGVCFGLALLAVMIPKLLGGGDWNGILQTTFTIVLWAVIGISAYIVRPQRHKYSLVSILGALIFTACGYKGLQASATLWGRPLGNTLNAIAINIDLYSGKDASFELAHHILGNKRTEPCGDLCHIMRQYANIRNATANADLKLVDPFVPTAEEKPNVFLFVIDSLRPDYLGAYNPKVDFTPNLDRFAGESSVLRNVYTEYAGTSLSEPAIWSGAKVLHAHFLQPFHRVNNLEKLVQIDGYQEVISWDTVVRQILSPSTDLVKIDGDVALWNNFEVCSTVQQTERVLDTRTDQRPVFFFAQPMNVHQYGRNSLPERTAQNWQQRPGFNDRIAYEVHQVDSCLGGFFDYLRQKGLYEKSIVIVTSDHGDATGEFGRSSHSLFIFPEIIKVPLIIHLPETMRKQFVYDDNRTSTLTDITPSLYYLLGHRPVISNAMFGRPLFAASLEELHSYKRDELFLASDVRAVFGILADEGRWLYVSYDSPAQSMLFDLKNDPNAMHNLVTPELKKQYDSRIIGHLQEIGDFYGYRPGVGSFLAAK